MATENTTPENLDSVMRRIGKLLAIAGDDRANPEEAGAAAAMAEKIMRKYQLEHADIIVASLKAGNDMVEEDCVAAPNTNNTRVPQVPAWVSMLAFRIGKVNDCKSHIPRPDRVAIVRFSGFSADVKVATFMFNYLVATVNRLVKAFHKTPAYALQGRAAANSYRMGVTAGILSSLQELCRAKEADTQQSKTGTSLMVVKAQAVAERFGAQGSKKLNSSISRDSHYSNGIRDGKSVNVSVRGLGGFASPSTLRIAA